MERGGRLTSGIRTAINDDVTFMRDGVSVARMRRDFARKAGQVLVLLDACRNDPGGRAERPDL